MTFGIALMEKMRCSAVRLYGIPGVPKSGSPDFQYIPKQNVYILVPSMDTILRFFNE